MRDESGGGGEKQEILWQVPRRRKKKEKSNKDNVCSIPESRTARLEIFETVMREITGTLWVCKNILGF